MKSKLKLLPVFGVSMVLTACANYTPNSALSSMSATTSKTGVATQQVCQSITTEQVAGLFDRWNDSLKTLNPDNVAANYAEKSILLPTVSNKARFTKDEKKDYFEHFLENKPVGKIDQRQIFLGCNSAVDAGTYTFTFGKNGAVVPARYTYTYAWDGKNWLITSHHSSGMPEK
jgi:uncharacterized protein (TIGR02246 family)